jgi:hypothetical protein
MTGFITDEEIETALFWLHDNASKAAQARADRIYLESYSKVLVAKIMKEHPSLSGVAQEREAYADPRYEMHLKGLHEAVLQDHKLTWLKDSCKAKMEAWQTMSANIRGAKL